MRFNIFQISKMKAKGVGMIATQYRDLVNGVERLVCVVQWNQSGQIRVTDVMGHLEEQPHMNVLYQHPVIYFLLMFILSIKQKYKKILSIAKSYFSSNIYHYCFSVATTTTLPPTTAPPTKPPTTVPTTTVEPTEPPDCKQKYLYGVF